MKEFVRGQKSKLAALTSATTLEVGVQVGFAAGEKVQISCFGVDGSNRLSDERYFVLHDGQRSPEGAVEAMGGQGGDDQRFRVDLAGLPRHVRKLVFAVTLDHDGGTMIEMRSGYLRLLAEGQEVVRFRFAGRDFNQEKAVIVCELYFKSVWRFGATGQGFNGGLKALLDYFGAADFTIPPPPPPAPRLRLSKITLEKKGDKQRLSLKKGGGKQPIHINLNWDKPNTGITRFLGFGAKNPDLDLGCMYRLADGNRRVIQPLGNNFGARDRPPYISLDKDDRSGAAADGENLYLYRPDLIDTVMVFAMIYEGSRDFTTVNGRLTIRDQTGNEIFIKLNTPDPQRTFCAICTIKKVGQSIVITKEERYFRGHRDADKHYSFGFRWRKGAKD
ncbi:MAG: TerD family protein [Ardenticatenaceae bacterium]